MVVMLVIVAVAFLTVLMVVMLVIVAVAFLTVIVVVMLVMVMELLLHVFKIICQCICMLNSIKDILAIQKLPACYDHGCLGILIGNKFYGSLQLFFGNITRMAEYNTIGTFYLIIKELSKILHIYTALCCINNSSRCIDNSIFKLCFFNSRHNVGKLTNTRRLNNYSVGGIFGHDLTKRLAKISHK